jgi:trimeric autotransporter adhesin
MKTLRTTFWVCCLLSLPQVLQAAPAQGYVIGWGHNSGGQATGVPSIQLSNGTFIAGNPFSTGTVMIAGQVLSNAVAVSAGFGLSLALRSDGTVVEWGGRTNIVVRINGQVLSNVVSVVAARNHSLALKKDGTLVTWGDNYVPSGLSNIAAIAADDTHSWVLKRDGTVLGWWREPSPSYGLLTAENLSNVVAIAVGPGPQGSTRGVALRRDGTVEHWGGESVYKDATPPEGLSNVVAVAAGPSHSLALKSDGTVIGWGWNKAGEATGTPTTNAPNLAYLSAGQVRIGGQVLSNVVSIAAGRGYSMALKNDWTVVAWGRMVNNLYPATVPAGLSNVVAIAAGEDRCLAITTNSAVAEHFRR